MPDKQERFAALGASAIVVVLATIVQYIFGEQAFIHILLGAILYTSIVSAIK